MRELKSPGRRSFIKQFSLLGATAGNFSSLLQFEQDGDLERSFQTIRQNLLQLINEERDVEKLHPLTVDERAAAVATAHARDMATLDFASHWGSDGLKPYMRYAEAGGYHATQENVSAADDTWSRRFADLTQDTAYLHVRLYQEKPPNDGHRKTILASQHTHVGIGLAVEKLRLRMVELFVAKYIELSPLNVIHKPQQTFTLTGKLLNPSHSLNSVEVFYEPLPVVPSLEWLRVVRSYSLPNDSAVLLPKLEPPLMYADHRSGVIEIAPDGAFSVPVTLFRATPGIYTIVCWVKRTRTEKAFPATELCVRVD